MQVCEIMRHAPVVCFPEDSVATAARTMAEQNVGMLPVVERGSGGRVIGVITDRDICLRAVAAGHDPASTPVSACMTTAPVCCGPRDDVRYAMLLMREHQFRHLPVVDAEHHIGGLLSFAHLANSQCDADALVDTYRLTCYPVTRRLLVTQS